METFLLADKKLQRCGLRFFFAGRKLFQALVLEKNIQDKVFVLKPSLRILRDRKTSAARSSSCVDGLADQFYEASEA